MVPVWTQCNAFNEPGGSLRVPDATRRVGSVVPKPCEMVELVLEFSGMLPNAHAEISVLRRPHRIHDLRVIAMPNHQRIVHGKTVDGTAVEGVAGKRRMPHPNDRVLF